ncbi:MAG TPA: hypothetical protein P5084_03590 [Paludibacter sp.]|nr:hypothetical protein [Paludibacter sp.]
MKTLKLITFTMIVLLFSSLLFAANPKTETADDISNAMVENMHKDLNLSKDQKETLKKKAKIYADKLIEARSMSNKEASYPFMEIATGEYQLAIDSLLTSDQKVQKEKKSKERIDEVVANLKSNK